MNNEFTTLRCQISTEYFNFDQNGKKKHLKELCFDLMLKTFFYVINLIIVIIIAIKKY